MEWERKEEDMEIETPKQPKPKKKRIVPSCTTEMVKKVIESRIASGWWWSCGQYTLLGEKEVPNDSYPTNYIKTIREDALVIPDIITIDFSGKILIDKFELKDSAIETLVQIIKQTANKYGEAK